MQADHRADRLIIDTDARQMQRRCLAMNVVRIFSENRARNYSRGMLANNGKGAGFVVVD